MKRILFLIAILAGLVYLATNDPPATATAPTMTNGERAEKVCRAEASPNKRDQDDCRSRYLLGVAFGDFQRQDSAKQSTARH